MGKKKIRRQQDAWLGFPEGGNPISLDLLPHFFEAMKTYCKNTQKSLD